MRTVSFLPVFVIPFQWLYENSYKQPTQISARSVNDYRLLFTLSWKLSIDLVNEFFFLVMQILINSLLTHNPIPQRSQ